MKNLLIRCGLWLAKLGGWAPCALPHLPSDDQVELAAKICADVQQRFTEAPGEYKRREALRVLMNLRPEAATKDLNLLIELALQ